MLKAGFYEKELTPPLGCDIPGYYTKRVADGVVDKLYCKAFAASDGNETIIMMAVDACSIIFHSFRNYLLHLIIFIHNS